MNLIEHGFDVEETHVSCHPPEGKYVNVSIIGLRSYIDDDDDVTTNFPRRLRRNKSEVI